MRILYFASGILVFVFWIHSGIRGVESEEEIPDYAKKQVLVWKGDITGIYENGEWIQIRIYRNFRLPQTPRSQEDFRKEILSQSWKIYGKNGILGEFQPTDLIWERKSRKPNRENEEWEAKLWGQVLMPGGISRLHLGAYIARFREEDSYLEPHHFFGKKSAPFPRRYIHPKDGKEMVLVDRGSFLYGQGTNSMEASFNPEYYRPKLGNLAELEPFYIDKYEVTNQEYARYLRETNSKPPLHWRGGRFPEGEEDYPVDYLSYEEVQGYANWAGKRIPTEWEWEKAARGPGVAIYQNRDETLSYSVNAIPYPFGSSYDSYLCNTQESGIGRSIQVYDLPAKGESPYGVVGMCGNVAEWTSSWYDKYPGQPYELKGYGKFYKVIRGGSYRDTAWEARVYHRSYGGIPNLREDRRAGFRLVKDIR